jgi:fibrillarin-like rRNA methylase
VIFLSRGGCFLLRKRLKNREIRGREFEILDATVIEPYERDHAMFLMKKGS